MEFDGLIVCTGENVDLARFISSELSKSSRRIATKIDTEGFFNLSEQEFRRKIRVLREVKFLVFVMNSRNGSIWDEFLSVFEKDLASISDAVRQTSRERSLGVFVAVVSESIIFDEGTPRTLQTFEESDLIGQPIAERFSPSEREWPAGVDALRKRIFTMLYKTGASTLWEGESYRYSRASTNLEAALSPLLLRRDVSYPYTIQSVFFGTNRVYKHLERDHVEFLSDRSSRLRMGVADICIPTKRKIGEVPVPGVTQLFGYTLWRERVRDDKHFQILQGLLLAKESFDRAVFEYCQLTQRFENSALLFIHGFNVTFDQALFRAAQIGHDTNFDAPVFVFSWPAIGSLSNYVTDMDSAKLSVPLLDEFIDHILSMPTIDKLHVVVHSMGCAALADLVNSRSSLFSRRKGKVGQLVLAAPDIDIELFYQISEYLSAQSSGVTLYASRTDKALLAAKKIRSGKPRAGDVPDSGPVVAAGIDTIDVSAVGTAVFSLNHSLYAESRGLLDDLGQLMRFGVRPPDLRMTTLRVVDSPRGRYWVIPR